MFCMEAFVICLLSLLVIFIVLSSKRCAQAFKFSPLTPVSCVWKPLLTFVPKKSLVPNIFWFCYRHNEMLTQHTSWDAAWMWAEHISSLSMTVSQNTVQKWIQLTGLNKKNSSELSQSHFPRVAPVISVSEGLNGARKSRGVSPSAGADMRSHRHHPAKPVCTSFFTVLSQYWSTVCAIPSRLYGTEAGGHFYKRLLTCGRVICLFVVEGTFEMTEFSRNTDTVTGVVRSGATGDSLTSTPVPLLISGVLLFVFGTAPVEPECNTTTWSWNTILCSCNEMCFRNKTVFTLSTSAASQSFQFVVGEESRQQKL